jgi:phosphonate transport system substrate-binding protein
VSKTNGTSALTLTFLVSLVTFLAGCGGEPASDQKTFTIGAIPDQNISQLNRRFQLFSEYLEDQTNLNVEYTKSNDYAALVTAFRRGDVQLGWFGGLTGVQARRAVPGSEAIAQRPRDEKFHSKFIVQSDLDVQSLEDLKRLTMTFGDQNSTSGHLMPRFYMLQAGLNLEEDLAAPPNFSGSHDQTWKLVESGAYEAGALNEAVWAEAVRQGQVDTGAVRVFHTTPPYHDYNWTIHADVNQQFGDGTKEAVKQALLDLDPSNSRDKKILDLFSAEGFIETRNDNYQSIVDVAKRVGIIK